MNKRYISVEEWKRQVQTMRQMIDELEANPPSFIATIVCPNCNSTDIVKNGTNEKLHQKYKCMNKDCSIYSFTTKE